MQKITPFLWFDGRAEEAMNFYVSMLLTNPDPAIIEGLKRAKQAAIK